MLQRKLTQKLLNWREKGAKKPLVLYGARQVGKSYAVREFALEYYGLENFVEINFEENKRVLEIFMRTLNPREIVESLEDMYQIKIQQEKTLIFFDEIQRCPAALNSVKYFAEDKEKKLSHYHLICAGSLLGVAYRLNLEGEEGNSEGLDFPTYPVGKDQQLLVYPLDFEEFLWANGEKYLANVIRDCYAGNRQLEQVSHLRAINLYRKYLLIGGMPEVVQSYVDREDHRAVAENIINGYRNDITKYIKYKSDKTKALLTYRSIPVQLAQEKRSKRFHYAAIKTGARGKNYQDMVQWLIDARLAIQCVKIHNADNPLLISEDRSCFKLYLSDVGLLSCMLGLNELNVDEFEKKHAGAVAENYVACALQAKTRLLDERLHYWRGTDKPGGAEVDFVITTNQGNVPVEVKSSVNTQSKSLNVYLEAYRPSIAYRLSQKAFGYNPEKKIKSIPLYAVFCIIDPQ